MRTCLPNRLQTRLSLLGRLRNWNDDASWQEFCDLYGQLLYNFVLRQGVPQDDADDVVQNTRFSVAKALRAGQWDPAKGSFKTWLLTVARNRVTDYFRRQPGWRRDRPAAPTATPRTATVERVPDPNTLTPEAVWDEEWRNNILELALERLKAEAKPAHFQIFQLHVIKHHPAAVVAKALGVSSGQVYLVKYRLGKVIEEVVRKLQMELEASQVRDVSPRVHLLRPQRR